MSKRLSGTTLIFDVTNERYLRTEVYASGDPAETVELRIVAEQNPRFDDIVVDDGSGPWRRITQRVEAVASQGEARFAPRRSPDECGEWDAAATAKTLEGMPTLDKE